jgi:DNA transformation protein
MSNSPSFVEHAVDLLALVGPVQARAMFGGHGVYALGVMFALLDDDELFLKADDACRARFLEAGCRQWVYPSPKGEMPMPYYRPPDDAHEDPEAMLPWARLALDAALRAAAAKAAKKGKPKGAPAAARAAAGKGAKAAKTAAKAGKAAGKRAPATRSPRTARPTRRPR